MHTLTTAELLMLWENGNGQPWWRRALLLLLGIFPERPIDELAQLSIGERDTCLLDLRERLFGARLVSLVDCPKCNEHVELIFGTQDIRCTALPASDISNRSMQLTNDGYIVQFRLPNSSDLAVIESVVDSDKARSLLLKRCVISVRHGNPDNSSCLEAEPIALLPAAVIDALSEQIAQADPQAETRLDIECPACKYRWQAVFDIVTYLWSEITVWAQRVLQEVHLLAHAYGWHEADILAMTPIRRRAYLEMLGYA